MRAHIRAALLAAVFALPACSDFALPGDVFTQPSLGPQAIQLPLDSVKLGVGKIFVIPARLPSGEDPTVVGPVLWKTSDTTVATVTSKGEVHAVAPGTATVTATTPAGGAPATVTVTVAAPPAPAAVDTAKPAAVVPGAPELPRATVDVSMPSGTGRSIQLNASGDLQAAINDASPGDQIVLPAGATFTGNFTLPAKSGSGWIIIRSSGILPAAGRRVRPSDAGQMARIVAAHPEYPAIQTAPGAHNYRLVGLEVTAPTGATLAYSLVALGDGSRAQNTLAQVPHDLVLDRVYVHGTPTLNFQRCIALNSGSTAIVDSYVSECHGKGIDSQAIAGWNGTGPYLIQNNELDGAAENILFGGADAAIPNLVPSDITIRGNHIMKPMAWQGVWEAKNLLELKSAERVLIEGNVFENSWVDGQVGFAMVLWSVNQGGRAPWSHTGDLTIRRNVIRHVTNGFSLTGFSNYTAPFPAPMNRVTITDNVLAGVGAAGLGTEGGIAYQIAGPIVDLTISHNTGLSTRHDVYLVQQPALLMSGLVIRDNIMGGGPFHVFSSYGGGKTAWALFAGAGSVCDHNVIVGGSANGAVMPPGNLTPATVADVGFVGYAGGDASLSNLAGLGLAPSSPYKGKASDGGDPGADLIKVAQAVSGVALP